MTRTDNLDFFNKLWFQRKMLTLEQRSLNISVYNDLIYTINMLLKENIIFTLATLNYSLIEEIKDEEFRKFKSYINKKDFGFLLNFAVSLNSSEALKVSELVYKDMEVVFCNKTLSLKVINNSVCANFILLDGVIKYLSYTIDGKTTSIKDVEFSVWEFDNFIYNFDDLYFQPQSLIDIVLYQ